MLRQIREKFRQQYTHLGLTVLVGNLLIFGFQPRFTSIQFSACKLFQTTDILLIAKWPACY